MRQMRQKHKKIREKFAAGKPKKNGEPRKYGPQNLLGHEKMGGRPAFMPPLDEWERGCECTGSKKALAAFFLKTPGWLHKFLNEEERKEEENAEYKSPYLELMKRKKQEMQTAIYNAYQQTITQYDPEHGITPAPSCVIFGLKAVGGFDENKKTNRIKEKELELKIQALQFEREKFRAQLEMNAVKITNKTDEETLKNWVGQKNVD